MGAGLSEGSSLRQLEPGLSTGVLNCQCSSMNVIPVPRAWCGCSIEKKALLDLKMAKKKRRKRSAFHCVAGLWHIRCVHHACARPVFDQLSFVAAKVWDSISVTSGLKEIDIAFQLYTHIFIIK